MRTIWKYQIGPMNDIHLEMPKGATVLICMMQQGEPCLWALVDPTLPKELRTFRLFATGQHFEHEGLKYIGTYQMQGFYMFHLFEVA